MGLPQEALLPAASPSPQHGSGSPGSPGECRLSVQLWMGNPVRALLICLLAGTGAGRGGPVSHSQVLSGVRRPPSMGCQSSQPPGTTVKDVVPFLRTGPSDAVGLVMGSACSRAAWLGLEPRSAACGAWWSRGQQSVSPRVGLGGQRPACGLLSTSTVQVVAGWLWEGRRSPAGLEGVNLGPPSCGAGQAWRSWPGLLQALAKGKPRGVCPFSFPSLAGEQNRPHRLEVTRSWGGAPSPEGSGFAGGGRWVV